MAVDFVREREFDVNGLKISCKEWGRPGYTPVIALHGWLDNAASFDNLIPHLDHIHLIALDMAGHGLSDHRSPDSSYEPWIDVGEVISIADQMLWEDFTLLGHSRGAIISGLIAGTFPERVKNLLLIDGYVPSFYSEKKAANHLRRAIKENRRFASSSPTYFHDFERAIQARVSGFVPLTYAAASTLAKRGVFEDKDGFFWGNDQRLKATNHVRFSEDQLRGFFESIVANVLLIRAENSAIKATDIKDAIFEWVPQMQIEKMNGSHHLHLEEQAEDVARMIQPFLN